MQKREFQKNEVYNIYRKQQQYCVNRLKMGNVCFEQNIIPSLADIKSSPRTSIQFAQLSIPNSFVESELQSYPKLPKNIMNRISQLGPFIEISSNKKQNRIYQMKNNYIYQGLLINNLFYGPGKLLLNDQTIIQSYFQNGIPNGKTRIIKSNGDYFYGVISNCDNKKQGVVYENGVKYQGEFLNSKPHGNGKQSTKVYIFDGKYENGKKTYGKLRWNLANPKHLQQYEGSFKDNLFQGFGTLITVDGKYTGNFEKGQKSGEGELEETSGKKYKGQFKKNKPNGEGKLYNEKGMLILVGKWVDGQPIAVENPEQN